MVYPDLMDQELANNLMLAEKLQRGKMTLIEMKAMQGAASFAGRDRVSAPPAGQDGGCDAAGCTGRQHTGAIGQPAPVVQPGTPQLQNTTTRQPHCQTARFGMMLETVCN